MLLTFTEAERAFAFVEDIWWKFSAFSDASIVAAQHCFNFVSPFSVGESMLIFLDGSNWIVFFSLYSDILLLLLLFTLHFRSVSFRIFSQLFFFSDSSQANLLRGQFTHYAAPWTIGERWKHQKHKTKQKNLFWFNLLLSAEINHSTQ